MIKNISVFTFCRNITDGSREVLIDPVVEDDVEVLDGRMIVVDIGELDENENIRSERFGFSPEQKLIFSTVDFVVELALAVQHRAAGRRRIVDEEILFVRVFQKPEFDDRVLSYVRIFYFYGSHFAAGRKVFRETEGDGVVREPGRVVVQVEDGDADVDHGGHFRNSGVVSLDHEVVVLARLAVERSFGSDDAGDRVDGKRSLVVRLSDKPVKKIDWNETKRKENHYLLKWNIEKKFQFLAF